MVDTLADAGHFKRIRMGRKVLFDEADLIVAIQSMKK
jgi:hypothetical protein